MSLLTNAHLHHFFRNKEMNHFYVMIAITTFAESLISIFVPIYLYTLNYSILKIIFFYFLVSLYFILFSYAGAKIVSKLGIKHALLLSAPFLILYYIGLHSISTIPILFFILPALLAFRTNLYNYSYHLNYITHSDQQKRGKEVSFIGSLGVISTILAPFIGGLITYTFGFAALYGIGSILSIIGIIPLFLTKDFSEKVSFTWPDLMTGIFSKKEKGLLVSFSCYAVESSIGRTIWPIFLIILLNNIEQTGLLVSLSMLITLITFYLVGRITDSYDQIKMLRWGTVLYFFAWIGRIFADSSLKVLLIDSYKNISEKVLYIPWVTYSYNLAAQRDTFRYIVSREVIFSLSRVVFLPVLMILFYLDFYSFVITFILAAVVSLGYASIERK